MVKGPGSVKTGVELPRRDAKSQAKSAPKTGGPAFNEFLKAMRLGK